VQSLENILLLNVKGPLAGHCLLEWAQITLALSSCKSNYYKKKTHTHLEFSIVKLVAVLKEKLVSGTEARFDTVLDHDARPRRT
jgi:hypothetical protein